MSQILTQIEYRWGLLSDGMTPHSLPLRSWRGGRIPQKVTDAVFRENLLRLEGVYGDKDAAVPVEYDHLRLVLTNRTVDIKVFNRGAVLFATDNEKLRRIHRVLCLLDATPPEIVVESSSPEPSQSADPATIPGPDDLAGWKAADLALSRRFAEYLRPGGRSAIPER